jgi:hypothetical protein
VRGRDVRAIQISEGLARVAHATCSTFRRSSRFSICSASREVRSRKIKSVLEDDGVIFVGEIERSRKQRSRRITG